MPTFNPQAPGINPENYIGWSKPQSVIPVDRSGGISNVGTAISGVTSLADQIVKETIHNDVTKGVDQARDQYTGQLESTANQLGIPNAGLGSTTNPSAHPNGQPMEILPTGDQQNIPPAVANGLSRIGSLQNGINNGVGGKVNDTLYSAQITSIAKQLRSQYPGYRDYIDAEVSKMSGMPVANAYYKNLQQDLNTALTNQKALLEKPINQLASAASQGVHLGAVTASQIYQGVLEGRITPMQGLQWLNGAQSANYDFKQREAARNDFKGSREILQITSSDDANAEAAAIASSTFNAIKLSTGQTMGQLVDSARRGTLSLSDSDAQKAGQVVQAQKDAYIQAVLSKWQQSGQVKQLGGTEAAMKIIQQNAVQFNNVLDAIYKKDTGLATFHLEQNSAMNADAKNGLLSSGELGQAALNMKALTDQLGPNWATTASGSALIANNIDAKYSTFASRQAARALSGNAADIRFPPSFSHDIDVGQAKGVPVQSGYYKSMADLVNGITDKQVTDPIKKNLANYFFAPANLGALEKLQRDSGSGRGQIVGADSAFMNMTAPAVTKEMVRLGQQTPQVFTNYRNWAQDSFNTLTRDDIATLNQVQQSGVQIKFNPQTHQFGLIAGPSISGTESAGAFSPSMLGNARQAINRLNMRLYNLARVEEASGGDVNEFLLNTLEQNGFKGEAGNQSIPNQMAREIMNNRLTPMQRINQTFGK